MGQDVAKRSARKERGGWHALSVGTPAWHNLKDGLEGGGPRRAASGHGLPSLPPPRARCSSWNNSLGRTCMSSAQPRARTKCPVSRVQKVQGLDSSSCLSGLHLRRPQPREAGQGTHEAQEPKWAKSFQNPSLREAVLAKLLLFFFF